MQRILVPIIVFIALLTAACGGDPSLPEATGKGSIRAINAIPTSPDVSFLIEERRISSVVYQGATSRVSYDDLNYTFNFEVLYAGETSLRRIASRNIDIVARPGLCVPVGRLAGQSHDNDSGKTTNVVLRRPIPCSRQDSRTHPQHSAISTTTSRMQQLHLRSATRRRRCRTARLQTQPISPRAITC